VELCVVGNPDNRRVAFLRAAAARTGVLVRQVVPWRELAAGTVTLARRTLVRVDSPGEDAEVDRLLRGATAPARHGEIVGLRAWYRGLRAALTRLAEAADRADALLLSPPDDVLIMFDKGACHAQLAAAGVPVPPALPAPGGYAELRAAMRAAGWARVFVKPAHGSSASGVLALQVAQGRVRATTPVELAAGGALYNSLRVRTYTDERAIASIVDRLAADGLHVERWFPKAGLAGRVVDLRVLVVAGQATHVVVRSSRTPMTNLHLGNGRGDLAQLRTAAGERAYRSALDTACQAASCFPGSVQVAVDLMFGPGWARHAVAEVNAFGDLLPGVLSAQGRDTYTEQLVALRTFAPGVACAT